MSKYDLKIMDLTVDGVKIGELVQYRTARQEAEARWTIAKLRRAYHKSIENCKSFKVPIIGNKND